MAAIKGRQDVSSGRYALAITIGIAVSLLAGMQQVRSGEPDARDQPRVRSLLELRNQGLIRQHWDLTCGAAAVATILTYQLGDPVSERDAAVGMLRASDVKLVQARLGFTLLDLKRFAASRGFVATGYGNMTLDEMLALAPAIVPVRIRKFGHFVVVRGRADDRILVADPAYGNRTISVDAFLKSWNSGIGFVVTRPDQPHPPNQMAAISELYPAPSDAALRSAVPGIRPKGGL